MQPCQEYSPQTPEQNLDSHLLSTRNTVTGTSAGGWCIEGEGGGGGFCSKGDLCVMCQIRCGQNRFTHLPEDDSVHARYYMHVIISTCNLLISSYIQGSIYILHYLFQHLRWLGWRATDLCHHAIYQSRIEQVEIRRSLYFHVCIST